MKLMPIVLAAVAAMALSACCYRPCPRPCAPAPSYCAPCAPAAVAPMPAKVYQAEATIEK